MEYFLIIALVVEYIVSFISRVFIFFGWMAIIIGGLMYYSGDLKIRHIDDNKSDVCIHFVKGKT